MSEFDKIIGYGDVKAELKKFCDVIKNPDKYAKLGVKMPGGILLDGEPGLGKTLMAKCFIAEAGCPAFVLRKEKPNGDFVNEIKEVFEKAKAKGRAIVFLDDMDKFANEDDRHPNAEEYVTVQSCIDDCKGHDIFVLATINESYCLPDSLLRAGRFDKIIELKKPRGKDAQLIIEQFLLEKQVHKDEIDTEELARLMEGHTCAELETIINDAAINAGFEGHEKIRREDIMDACLRMLLEAPECLEALDAEAARRVAVHEAGHAVIAEVLCPGAVNIVSIRRSTGSVGGIVKNRKETGFEYSQTLHENEVIIGLGGKAANEVVFGDSDMGCADDVKKVFSIVTDMIDECCAKGFENHLLDHVQDYNTGEGTRANRENAIVAEISRHYERAKKILIENRELLDAVTNALIERKTLTYNDIASIRSGL